MFYFAVGYATVYSYQLRLHFNQSFIEGDDVFVSVFIDGGLPEEIFEYIQKGITVVINYRVELKEKRFLLDKKISSIYFSRKVYYDFVKGEYVVLFSESGKEERADTFEGISRHIYNVRNIDIAKSSDMNDNSLYYYSTRFSITFINAYPYLDIFFTLMTPLKYRIKWLHTDPFKKDSLIF